MVDSKSKEKVIVGGQQHWQKLDTEKLICYEQTDKILRAESLTVVLELLLFTPCVKSAQKRWYHPCSWKLGLRMVCILWLLVNVVS